MGRVLGSMRRCGRRRAQIDADKRLRRPYRRDQRADAHDVHDALEIVGQYVQRHLGANMLQRLHLETSRRTDDPAPMSAVGRILLQNSFI